MLITNKIYRFIFFQVIFMASLVEAASGEALNFTVAEFCRIYENYAQKSEIRLDAYESLIISNCAQGSSDEIDVAESQPVFNFRAIPLANSSGEFCPDEPEACSLFRGGQPAPSEETDPAADHFSSYHFGYDFSSIKDYGINKIINLRYDPQQREADETSGLFFVRTFGPDMPFVPLSPGEAKFRFSLESEIVERAGANSIFMPTVPESEHFVGHFVPRLDKFVCRLPEGIPDGVRPHWLNGYKEYQENAESFKAIGQQGILVSDLEDCADLYEKWGELQVKAWVAEVKKFGELTNQIFVDIAKRIINIAEEGNRVLFHCSSGTDRVGRISAIIEAINYDLSLEEVEDYKGPLSNSKIDLIALNYLLSQRAGKTNQFSHFFPLDRGMQYSPLFLSLSVLAPLPERER